MFLDEIATLISGSTVAGGATGWLLFKGHMPDSTAIGDKALAVIETEGFGTLGRIEAKWHGLQILIRGDARIGGTDVYQTAQAKLNQAKGVLHGYTGSSGTSSNHYPGIWCQNAGFLQWDENWRPEFVANFRCLRATT